MTVYFNLEKLSKQYVESSFQLKNVSFSGGAGDIIGLIGKNGAGKTTILNILSGIDTADSGQILIKDEPVTQDFLSNAVGYLPASLNLYDYLTLQENIDFILKVRNLDRNEAKIFLNELLEEMELSDQLDKKLQQLSKGMRQKFNFIMIILHKPQLLLLDEPFDGLDPQQIRVMQQRIMKLAQEGVLVIFSSHIISFVTKLCNKTIFIEDGQLKIEIENMSDISDYDLESLFNATKK